MQVGMSKGQPQSSGTMIVLALHAVVVMPTQKHTLDLIVRKFMYNFVSWATLDRLKECDRG